jgi:WD40 repeat protein
MLILRECTKRDDQLNCQESNFSIRDVTNDLVEVVTKNIPGDITALVMSPTGKMVALAVCNRFEPDFFLNPLILPCADGQIELFAFSKPNLEMLTAVKTPAFGVQELIFSAHEKQLVINNGLEIVFWDITSVTNPKQLGSLPSDTNIFDMAIDSEGKKLVIGKHQEISTWDISDPTHPKKLSTRQGFPGFVTVTLDQDGKILASASEQDTNIMLWDLSDQTQLIPMYSLSGLHQNAGPIYFRPDGKSLISTYLGVAPIIIWDLDPESWIQKACQIAGRNFTVSEWTQYFPNEQYRVTCPQWPPGY